MPQSAQIFLAVGGILALGMATDMLGQRTFLPRVSLLVIVGVLVGPAALNLIPAPLLDDFDIISMMTLVIIGFLLGGKLTRDSLISSGNTGLLVSLSAAVGTTIIVFSGLYLLNVPIDIALLLACIAAATAPAATFDIVMESGSSSKFAGLLLMVVALDDVWGLILFSFALAAVGVINGNGSGISPLFMVAQDIGGGVLIGLLLGLPAAFLTGPPVILPTPYI